MAELVVDASVVVKWYIPEQNHEQARTLRDDYLDGAHDLLAPTLLPFEVINALKYSGHYEGDRLVDASRSLPEYGITLVPYREAGPVADVAVDLNITLYDASYLALARANEAMVYTADSRLLDATEGGEYSECRSHIREYNSESG
jgi:predicted nucleic acid-binding protein